MLTGIQRSRLQQRFFSHCMIHRLAIVNLSCLVWSEAVCCPLSSQERWAGRQTSSEGDLETESLWWEKRSIQMTLFSVIFANYKAIDCYSQSLPAWGSLITDDNFLAFFRLVTDKNTHQTLHPMATSASTKWSLHIALSSTIHSVKFSVCPTSHTTMLPQGSYRSQLFTEHPSHKQHKHLLLPKVSLWPAVSRRGTDKSPFAGCALLIADLDF